MGSDVPRFRIVGRPTTVTDASVAGMIEPRPRDPAAIRREWEATGNTTRALEDEAGAARRNRAWTASPAIDRIDPRSPTGARVLARHRAMAVQAPQAAASAATSALVRAMVPANLGGRRHTAEAFKALRRGFPGVFGDGPGVVAHAWGDDGDAPRSSPSTHGAVVRVDPSHLVDDGPGMTGTMRLRTTACVASRDSCSWAWFALPVSWRQHAAERVHKRTGFAGDVHAALGAELHRCAAGIAAMARAASRVHPDAQVAVPFMGGLLMGSIDVGQAGVSGASLSHTAMRKAGRAAGGAWLGAYGSHDALEAWTSFVRCEGAPGWTAMTFVGPADATPARVAYAAEFAALAAGLDGDATTAAAIAATLPVQGDRPTPGARVPTTTTTAMAALAVRALAAGIIGTRPVPRDAVASVAVRRRDIDADPVLRGFRSAGMQDLWT